MFINKPIQESGIAGLTFKYGFTKTHSISVFGKKYDIAITFSAYAKKDGVTTEQKSAYKAFEKNELKMLIQAETRFKPTNLLIGRKGEIGLLFDDKDNPDEGIVVDFGKKIKIVSQDDYL